MPAKVITTEDVRNCCRSVGIKGNVMILEELCSARVAVLAKFSFINLLRSRKMCRLLRKCVPVDIFVVAGFYLRR